MQCLILDDTAFVAEQCITLAESLRRHYHVVACASGICGRYPQNVVLNAAVIGKYVICRADTLDVKVHAYCESHGYQLIHVNQGYSKCSCAVVGNHAVITADKGIFHSLSELKDLDSLLIGEGSIRLSDTANGFIGGASGYDQEKNTLYFCGNLTNHPDAKRIFSFCRIHSVRIASLTDDPLTDIGGMIFC